METGLRRALIPRLRSSGASGVTSPDSFGEPLKVVAHRYHLHLPGLVYVAVTVLLAMGAIRSQNNLLFIAFGASVAGIFVSGALSGAALMGLQLWRAEPGNAHVGERAVIRYRLRNRNRFFPAFALVIEESPDTRWDAPIARPLAFSAQVAAKHSVEVESHPPATRRGRVTLDVVRVWTTYPFGLTRKSVTFSRRAELVVAPRVVPLPSKILAALGTDEAQTRAAAARRAGEAEEFFGLREYESGDHPRQIAWRLTARTGEVVVRQHTSRQPQRMWIRAVTPTPDPEQVEGVLALTASLAADAAKRGWSFGVIWEQGGVMVTMRSGDRHLQDVWRALALAEHVHASGGADSAGTATWSVSDARRSAPVVEVTPRRSVGTGGGSGSGRGADVVVHPEDIPSLANPESGPPVPERAG